MQIGRLLVRESIVGSHRVVERRLVELVVLHDCLAAVGMVDLALHLLVTLQQAVEVHEVILGSLVGETGPAFRVLCKFLWGLLVLRLRDADRRRLQFHVKIQKTYLLLYRILPYLMRFVCLWRRVLRHLLLFWDDFLCFLLALLNLLLWHCASAILVHGQWVFFTRVLDVLALDVLIEHVSPDFLGTCAHFRLAR